MEWGWSKGHRLEDQAERRKKLVRDSLPLLGLTEEQYKELQGFSNFLLIVGIALERRITYWSAEIAFYDERREAEKVHLREQLNVDTWHGDGTNVYTYNKDPSFGNDLELKHALGGHIPKRGPLSKPSK